MNIPVHTYKLPKRKVGKGTAKELLLGSCPAMELPSPGIASASHESAKSSPLLRELLRFLPTTQQLLGEFQQYEIFPTTESRSLVVLIHVYILSIRQDLLSPRGYYRFYLYHDVSLHLYLHLWIYFDHLVASKINQESSETHSA
jgi:hypothetical protein